MRELKPFMRDEVKAMDGRTLPRVRELKLSTIRPSTKTYRRTLPRVRELKPVYQYNGRSRRWCRTLPRVRELKPK